MTNPTQALERAAQLGPYFGITTDPNEEVDPTWRPLPETDPHHLNTLIDQYAQRLGTDDRRVAASILFQGIASRLWSPVVACAAQGVVPNLETLHWRWAPGAPIALWLADPTGWPASPDKAFETVVNGHLNPLREMLLKVVKLADGLIWGNAASALAGTLYATRLAPDLAPTLTPFVQALLKRPPLDTAGDFGPRGFIRRSCCLYYKVPPGGEMCGDCALLTRR
ncbi:(2Fe-2S)-binding protein [Actinomadura rupiterrae]|uniref:(2Fe-2S)-binding protein n=1 Tax=Actinomadura rupiterrae TaxID=559627 RepID=UPI0020A341E4|nr:(2Fe-2S)-binding protein [Actinomadura rupiterrae]MCP2339829.1 ferric iron reductase protein FhuF [Actinomadura rupiterrae]